MEIKSDEPHQTPLQTTPPLASPVHVDPSYAAPTHAAATSLEHDAARANPPAHPKRSMWDGKEFAIEKHSSTSDASSNDDFDLTTPMATADNKRRKRNAKFELTRAVIPPNSSLAPFKQPIPAAPAFILPTPGQSSTWTAQPTSTTPTPASPAAFLHHRTQQEEETHHAWTPGPDLQYPSDPPRTVHSNIYLNFDLVTHIQQSDADDHQHYYSSDFKIKSMLIEENRKFLDQFSGQHDRHVASTKTPVKITSSAPDSITFTGEGVPLLHQQYTQKHHHHNLHHHADQDAAKDRTQTRIPTYHKGCTGTCLMRPNATRTCLSNT